MDLNTSFTLADLGWTPFFQNQLDQSEVTNATPCRISAVHRNRLEAIGETGELSLVPTSSLSTGEIAVGDWGLSDGQRLVRLLDRRTCLARRAAGTGTARQLIAANVDTLFIVTSCNADFNPARIERYLALAIGAGVEPVSFGDGRVLDGSAFCTQLRSAFAASMLPSGSSVTRPEAIAFLTLVWLTP